MPAHSLSRWTPAFFVAALLSLLLAEVLLVAGFGLPFDVGSGESLAVLHLVVIGWLSLLMAGALLQFVPVLVGRPLFAPGLALPAFLLLLAGLGVLFLSFLGMSGVLDSPGGLFVVAALLLGSGFLLLVFTIGGTIARARPLPLAAIFILLGLLALAVTAGLGTVFAGTLSGMISSSLAVNLLIEAPPVHAFLGLFGWLMLTAIGTSYRLLPMFLLGPDRPTWPMRATLCLGGLSLLLAMASAPFIATGLAVQVVMLVAMTAGFGALATYLIGILQLFHARKRKVLDLSAKAATAAYGALGLSGLLFAPAMLMQGAQPLMAAAIFLFIFGWLSGLGLAKLYKIIPFLTWLEFYGPRLGRAPTPKVQDLVCDSRAGWWFILYFTGAAAGALALACEEWSGFRAACALLLLATSRLCREFRRIRLLTYINAEIRLPVGGTGPRLTVSTGS